MKTLIVLVLLYTLAYQGYSQNLCLYKEAKPFSTELKSFIQATNHEHPKNCKYYVYVVYVYPLDTNPNCIGYTVSYIFNSVDVNNIGSQYYFKDSINLIAVTFDPLIKEKSIEGLKLNKLIDNSIFLDKLIPKGKGFLTGTTEAFIYKDCPQKKETVLYENSDIIPREKSIYRRFPTGLEIKLIKEGNLKDSIIEKQNQ